MINSRRIISAIICGLIFTAAVRAGMVPVSQQYAQSRQGKSVCDKVDFNSYNFPQVADLDPWSFRYLTQVISDDEQISEIEHLQSFTNGPDSLNLCLSALIGLGLCSSVHFVKRISFSFVPDWYHNGGPFQIGHSFAISPEYLCPIAVCCFVQPICFVEGHFIKCSQRVIMSFWRKSQFTPDVIASRGPPLFS